MNESQQALQAVRNLSNLKSLAKTYLRACATGRKAEVGVRKLIHKYGGLFAIWAMTWGGEKRMGGGKRTEQRTLQKISGPLDKSVRSGQSSTFLQGKKSSDTRGGWKTYQTKGVQNHFLGGVSFVRFSSPLLFPSPPPWRRPKNQIFGHPFGSGDLRGAKETKQGRQSASVQRSRFRWQSSEICDLSGVSMCRFCQLQAQYSTPLAWAWLRRAGDVHS